MFPRFHRMLPAVLFCLIALPATALAEARVEASYHLSFSGFRLGKLQLRAAYDTRAYTIRGQGRITGIAGVFLDFQGETRSTGLIGRNGPAPLSHDISYTTSRRGYMTDMSFAGGRVKELKAEPPLQSRAERVPLTRSHMANVIDPISALAIRVPDATGAGDTRVCERTLRIFDGRERYDIRLSGGRAEAASASGFKGTVVTCRVGYRPIAGHRTDNDFVNDMASRSDMTASFVRLPASDIFVFYAATIPSAIGTFAITPASLELSSGDGRQASN